VVAYQKSASGAEFVVSVIHNNKPVREFNEGGQRVCRIPFNSEYKLRIKSKTWKKALVSISIDGTDVLTGGKQLILSPYQSVELERFVDDLNAGKKFKFISVEQGASTGEVQDPTSPENGLIRVQIFPEVEWHLSTASTGGAIKMCTGTSWSLGSAGGASLRGMAVSGAGGITETCNSSTDYITGVPTTPTSTFYCTTNAASAAPIGAAAAAGACMDFMASDKGATAEGGHSGQRFHVEQANFQTETTPVVFDLWLKGVRSEIRNECRDLVIHAASMVVDFLGTRHLISSYELSRGGGAVIKTVNGSVLRSDTYVVENN
jgi:hypothetical protein